MMMGKLEKSILRFEEQDLKGSFYDVCMSDEKLAQ